MGNKDLDFTKPERVRLYADLDIAIDTALRVACAQLRISRKKFLEDAILHEIARSPNATARDVDVLRRATKKG